MLDKDLNNQEKLEEVYEMTLENNHILRGLRRQQNIGTIFKIIYWVVILASLGGAYYYVRPIVDAFTGGNASMAETAKQFEQLRAQLPEAKIIEQFLHKGEISTTDKSSTTQP